MGEAQDELGNPLHTKYEADPSWRGTRIPSGKSKGKGGGSYGFNPHSLNVPQNIIACDGDGMTKVTQVTAAQLSRASIPEHDMPRDQALDPADITKLQLDAEERYKRAAGIQPMGKAEAPIDALPSAPPTPPDLLGAPAEVEEPTEDTAPPENTQRAVKSRKPIPVTFKGAFGKVTHPFTTLFRDGICLVLVTDQRQIGSLYTLPDIDDEPMDVLVQVGDKELDCSWAGIQFTMPDVPVTFTVLLIREERTRD